MNYELCKWRIHFIIHTSYFIIHSIVLSIVLPTYNEAKNLPVLIERLQAVLKQGDEIIVVDDDSPDKTWEVAEHLAKTYPHVRVLRRTDRRGLSSAVVEGFAMAKGKMLMVMDSDLQHDPNLVSQMRAALEGGADIVAASRYIKGGSVGNWVRGRRYLSKTATYLAQWLPNVRVSDPMSGFFAIKASAYKPIAKRLRPSGFKILLEVLAFLPKKTKVAEVPLQFQLRHSGESKLSPKVQLEFLVQLVRIFFHRFHVLIFTLIALWIAIPLAVHVRDIHMLYTDPSGRDRVQLVLQAVADREGWLLSDIRLDSVGSGSLVITHVVHGRGTDPETCFSVPYTDLRLIPCVD